MKFLNILNESSVVLENLNKIESELSAALGALRGAVKSGHIHPDALKTITGHIFKDTMVPSMGNRKAYQEFVAKERPGVHVSLDLNDFGTINKLHGFEVGDAAIKSAGKAIREAADASSSRAKAHRVGGDEFMLHFPNIEQAHAFAKNVRSKFGEIPKIGGTHRLSASIGMGESPEHAEKSLIQAKTAKKAAQYQLGEADTHAHSMVPGNIGHLPVGVELKAPVKTPPMPKAPTEPTSSIPVALPNKPVLAV